MDTYTNVNGIFVELSKAQIKEFQSLYHDGMLACSTRHIKGYMCTRDNDHHTIHVAHGSNKQICAIWNDDFSEKG